MILRKLRTALFYAWFPAVLGAAVYTGRLVYEETILAHQNGPQMYMFSFFHLHPFLYLFSLLSLLFLHGWLIIWIFVLYFGRRHLQIGWRDYSPGIVTVVILSIGYAPWDHFVAQP